MRAAIAADYGIEVDVQISADGEAMVHHDDVLGRLTEGEGRLDQLTAAELKRVPFRGSAEHMMTLGDLCDLVGGRVTMLVELKSRFDGDGRLPARVAEVLAGYRGPVAPMSFDPASSRRCGKRRRSLVRGIIAAKYRPHPYWDLMPAWMRHGMGYLLTALRGAAAIRGLCGRRSAGAGAVIRAACLRLAAVDLGGAHRGRAATRGALGRPDDFRRLSAMNRARERALGRLAGSSETKTGSDG